MATVSGVLQNLMQLLKGVVPIGVDPIYFFATFLILFAIIFVVLKLITFFKNSPGICFIIAAVIAYFAASSAFVTVIVSKLFPNVGLVMMGILGLLLVVAFVSPTSLSEGIQGSPFIVIIAFLIIIYLTYSYAAPELEKQGFISGSLGTTINNEDMTIIIAIIIVLGVIGAIVYSGRAQPSPFTKYLFGRGPV